MNIEVVAKVIIPLLGAIITISSYRTYGPRRQKSNVTTSTSGFGWQSVLPNRFTKKKDREAQKRVRYRISN